MQVHGFARFDACGNGTDHFHQMTLPFHGQNRLCAVVDGIHKILNGKSL